MRWKKIGPPLKRQRFHLILYAVIALVVCLYQKAIDFDKDKTNDEPITRYLHFMETGKIALLRQLYFPFLSFNPLTFWPSL